MQKPEEKTWCVVGNLGGVRCAGVDASMGTRHFSVGSKLYVMPAVWHGDGQDHVQVLGRSRGGRWIGIVIASKKITNWRVQLVRNPHVLELFGGNRTKRIIAIPWTEKQAREHVAAMMERERTANAKT